jgi:hypothetical protein
MGARNHSKIWLIIALFQLWLIFLTALDHLIHQTLYAFGLRFSYEWADPYWILLSLVFALTTFLATVPIENRDVAWRVGFTFFGEWVGGFLDTIFWLLHGRLPPETEIWWWNPFHRFLQVEWHTLNQYSWNIIWAIILLVVWLSYKPMWAKMSSRTKKRKRKS